MAALTEPTQIEGPHKSREETAVNGELWNFAGEAQDAVLRCNADKLRILTLESPDE